MTCSKKPGLELTLVAHDAGVMIPADQARAARRRAIEFLTRAGIVLTPVEAANIEVADFGLGELDRSGLQIVIYAANDRYSAKELVLFPGQTCPEHAHPPVGDDPGKQETFRCRWGLVWLYVPGPRTESIQATVPPGHEDHYSVYSEIELRPGDQYTLAPGTAHWFQAGPKGAVVSEFSSVNRDEFDVFRDPRIKRLPEYGA